MILTDMSNRRRSKRFAEKLQDSVITDFITVNDPDEVQSGPKRQRTKGKTPTRSRTPLTSGLRNRRHQRASAASSPSPSYPTPIPSDSSQYQATHLPECSYSQHPLQGGRGSSPSSSMPQITTPRIVTLPLNFSFTSSFSSPTLDKTATADNLTTCPACTLPLYNSHFEHQTAIDPATTAAAILTSNIPVTLLDSTSTPPQCVHSVYQNYIHPMPNVLSDRFTSPDAIVTCGIHLSEHSTTPSQIMPKSSNLNTSEELVSASCTSLNSSLTGHETYSSHQMSTPLTAKPHSVSSHSKAIGTPMVLRSALRSKDSSQRQPKRSISFHDVVAVKEFSPTNPTQESARLENMREQLKLDKQNTGYVQGIEEQSVVEDDSEKAESTGKAGHRKIPLINGRKEEVEEEDSDVDLDDDDDVDSDDNDDDDDDDDEHEMNPPKSMPRGGSLPLTQQRNRKDKKVAKTGRTQNCSTYRMDLPCSVLRNLFLQHSSFRVSKEATNVITKFSQLYLNQVAKDLAAYAQHAGRCTLEIEDAVLLLKRHGFLDSKRSFDYLVNSQLPLEYVQQLLPCAQSGKKIVP